MTAAAKAFVKSCEDDIVYPYIRNYYVRLAGSKDSGKTLHYNQVGSCHGSLVRVATGCSDLYTGLAVAHEDLIPLAIKFWSFILDPNKSPWKSVLKGVEVLYNKDKNPCGVRLDPTQGSAQVMGNLCIATRIPTEHQNVLRAWVACVEAGLSEAEALVAANIVGIDASGHPRTVRNNGHYPFDTNNLDLKRFTEANPIFQNKSLASGATYTPSNRIWWAAKYDKVAPYSDAWYSMHEKSGTHPLIEKLQGSDKYQGAFPRFAAAYEKAHGKLEPRLKPWKHCIKVILENRRDL